MCKVCGWAPRKWAAQEICDSCELDYKHYCARFKKEPTTEARLQWLGAKLKNLADRRAKGRLLGRCQFCGCWAGHVRDGELFCDAHTSYRTLIEEKVASQISRAIKEWWRRREGFEKKSMKANGWKRLARRERRKVVYPQALGRFSYKPENEAEARVYQRFLDQHGTDFFGFPRIPDVLSRKQLEFG